MTGNRGSALAAGLALVMAWAVPGAAAAPLSPVSDRYEPGDEATLVGYVAPPPDGWEAGRPYTAFLKEVGPLSSSVRIGPLDIAEVDTPAGRALRVWLVFRIPPDVPPGYYEVPICDRLCTGGLGDLSGSHPLNVGVEPTGPIVREWARNEPEIANLPADSVVAGPGFLAPAAELRAPATTATTATTVVAATRSSRLAAVPAPTVPLGPPESPAGPGGQGNGWFVVLGISLALACTAAVLVAMRQ